MGSNKNREKIDQFLIALDKFLLIYPDFQSVFILIFKVNNRYGISMATNKKSIWLKILPVLINRDTPTGKWWLIRKEPYVRKVAYNLEYKEVHDFSYEDIFWKIVFNEWLAQPKSVVENFNKVIPNTLIIPTDFYWDNNLYF